MTNTHLNEDDLVLHYYGELADADTGRIQQHLAACAACHDHYARLQRVMAAVDAMPEPMLPPAFERTVWARLEPQLPPRRGWFSWLALTPATLAWASAVVILVAGAFFAGRMTQPQQSGPGARPLPPGAPLSHEGARRSRRAASPAG